MAKTVSVGDRPKSKRKMRTSQGASKNTRYTKKSQKKNGRKTYRGQGK